ncbi:MAG TPA: DUF2059 domain-containing protein [Sphingomonas sp.]|jgi:hypothetical protein|uniref:DUF2059 domain-containing protein n=1 Tax=Sphingomonas sp. TaxID=28214 RepID=UPI002EDAB86F
MISILLAAALAAPAPAQTVAVPPPVAAQPAAIDPARLTAATRIIGRVWPLGTYRRMMDGMMDRIMESTMASMYAMPVRDMAGMGGASADAQKALGNKTMGETIAAADPAFRERMKITTKVMTDEMVGMMSAVEPQVQTALARAYATRFTLAQLDDLDRFFATPTGAVYAREAMMLYTDPEMIKAMQAFVPTLMQRMPAIMEKVKAATAHLPAVKTPPQAKMGD